MSKLNYTPLLRMATLINAGKLIWYILGIACIGMVFALYMTAPASTDLSKKADAYRDILNFFLWFLIPVGASFIAIGLYLQLREIKSRVAFKDASRRKRAQED